MLKIWKFSMTSIIIQMFFPIQDTMWNKLIFLKSQAAKKTDCLSITTDVFIYKVVKMMELEITSEVACST